MGAKKITLRAAGWTTPTYNMRYNFVNGEKLLYNFKIIGLKYLWNLCMYNRTTVLRPDTSDEFLYLQKHYLKKTSYKRILYYNINNIT